MLKASGDQGLALAQRISDWVYQTIRYVHGVTDIHTTAAEALALGRGVCQDYAHIMLVLCRLCGLPARYVSGHLLGEGGTHAWIEVLIPATDRADTATAGLGFAGPNPGGARLYRPPLTEEKGPPSPD